ncbi:glycosyl hydrolase [Streptomyces sp. PSKA54]|uniref:Glycosyl hydrolase n=1 Tax=Streptomyces himalayensis subsp. aureolus TaxID=2758039 RepID=A0A7W2D3M9_9ACTN|nr:glycosyl hydrolase [Streptomyces himalayensis]MBA4864039.1 glycosyl hydrolase [Streptomyces himalayensis subsp. aureolus]
MRGEIDFRLDGLVPADQASARSLRSVFSGDLHPVAEHHNGGADRSESYLLVYDESAAWGVPGEPQLRAITITRDGREGLFTFKAESHALAALGMNWLIERGCPPEVIIQPVEGLLRPADDETVQLEARLATSKGRYRIRETWTEGSGGAESYVIAEDAEASAMPVRVFLEEPDFGAGTYRLREGAFPSFEAASSWLRERNGPLPAAPEQDLSARRAAQARARSTGLPTLRGVGSHDGPPPEEPQYSPRRAR